MTKNIHTIKGSHYRSSFLYHLLTFLKLGSEYHSRFKIASKFIEENDMVLDLCGGTGSLRKHIHRNCEYICLDASENFSRQLTSRGIKCINKDITRDVHSLGKRADVAVMIISLCHFRGETLDLLLENIKLVADKVVIVEEVLDRQRKDNSFLQRTINFLSETNYYKPKGLFTSVEFYETMKKHGYQCQQQGKRYAVGLFGYEKPQTKTKPLKLKKNFLLSYLQQAPISLSLERALECNCYSQQEMFSPVVDFGCGDGLFASILFDEKIDVGIDVSLKKLEHAKRTNSYKKLYSNVDQIASNYNTVLCNSVLEHVGDLKGTLSQIHSLICDDGRLYVTVPSEEYAKHTLVFSVLKWLRLHKLAEKSAESYNAFWGHKHCYSKGQWSKMFSNAGFKIVSVQEYASKKICLMGNACLPFAAFAYINKLLLGRWILCRPFRRSYIKLFFKTIEREQSKENNSGGLLFFSLVKNNA